MQGSSIRASRLLATRCRCEAMQVTAKRNLASSASSASSNTEITETEALAKWDTLLDVHPARRIVGTAPSPSQPPPYQIVHINDPPLFKDAQPPTPAQLAEGNAAENVIDMLAKTTNFTQSEIKNFHRYALVIHRVSVQTSKGKIPSMYAMVIAGNGNGLLGVGQGKHSLVVRAIDKAFASAVKSMRPVERCDKRTVWGEQKGKWSATHITMWPRPPGFGLRTSPLIHQIAKAAGITDLSSKVRGSRNAMNTVRCAVRMLQKRSQPQELGDGFGGPMGRKHKGYGMRNANDIAQDRDRRAIAI